MQKKMTLFKRYSYIITCASLNGDHPNVCTQQWSFPVSRMQMQAKIDVMHEQQNKYMHSFTSHKLNKNNLHKFVKIVPIV